jgi:hypothetical protein
VFKAKVDTWLIALLGGMGLPCVALAPFAAQGSVIAAVSLGLTGVVLLGALWVLRGTRYALDDGAVQVHMGPWRWRLVPIDEITQVRPSRSLIAAPAPSLDRLALVHGGGEVLVSPSDRPGFLAALDAAAPNLVRVGEGLERP